jgi:hypothetical protein
VASICQGCHTIRTSSTFKSPLRGAISIASNSIRITESLLRSRLPYFSVLLIVRYATSFVQPDFLQAGPIYRKLQLFRTAFRNQPRITRISTDSDLIVCSLRNRPPEPVRGGHLTIF